MCKLQQCSINTWQVLAQVLNMHRLKLSYWHLCELSTITSLDTKTYIQEEIEWRPRKPVAKLGFQTKWSGYNGPCSALSGAASKDTT